MNSYTVKISNTAVADIKKLSKVGQKKIVKALEKLKSVGRPSGMEMLGGHPGFFRIKAGEYRIIFARKDDASLIVVLVVRHRKDVYNGLEFLDQRLVRALAELAEAEFAKLDPRRIIDNRACHADRTTTAAGSRLMVRRSDISGFSNRTSPCISPRSHAVSPLGERATILLIKCCRGRSAYEIIGARR